MYSSRGLATLMSIRRVIYNYSPVVHSFEHRSYEINTMPNFLSLLMLTIIVGVTCHPIQRRKTEDYRCTVITNVCTVLWHIQDTMEHCPAGSACNSTAMGIIHSVIRTDFSAWVRWPFDGNTMRLLIVMFFYTGEC